MGAGTATETEKLDIDAKSQRGNICRVLDIVEKLEGQYGGGAPVATRFP